MKGYVGIDVSKSTLDVQLDEQYFQVSNDKKGIHQLIKTMSDYVKAGHCITLIVFEASGGYEKLLAKSLRGAGYPFHLAHANKVRSFARAKGFLAKTDKIDAEVIREYGILMQITPDEDILSPEAEELGDLLKRRAQLTEDRKREDNRLEKAHTVESKRSIKSHISWIKKEIKKIEEQLAQARQSSTDIKKSVELLISVPGIGELVASYVVAFLPELGRINPKSIAALVGVAPLNRDSGRYKGKRYIQGGRGMLRNILYMAAVASTRWNPDLKIFYQRLREQGKPAKVAIVAVARKLLMILSSVMKRQTPWQEKAAILA